MRALFLGTPAPIAARPLWEWLEAGHQVSEFWVARGSETNDWRRDRWLRRLRPGWSVSAALDRYAIPLRRTGPLRKDPELQSIACSLDAEVLISSCYPYIVADPILDHFGPRAVNLHPALLPNYRGPNPIASMLFHEEADTAGGITLHQMVSQLDEGPVIGCRAVPRSGARWFRHWEAQLAIAAGQLIRDELPRYLAGELLAKPQQGPGSYHRLLDSTQFSIGPETTFDRATYLLNELSSLRPVHIRIDGKQRRVTSLIQEIGPPTGQPPVARPLSFEVDLADARVKLRRRRPGSSKYWGACRLLEFARTSAATPAIPSEPPATSAGVG